MNTILYSQCHIIMAYNTHLEGVFVIEKTDERMLSFLFLPTKQSIFFNNSTFLHKK